MESQIEAPGDRAVVGFDVRERRVASQWRPATMDSTVWPRIVSAEEDEECNGLNLFNSLGTARKAVASENGSIVAFDFPLDVVSAVAATFGVGKQSLAVLKESNWQFVGYDVADVRTQSSGFYSFEWKHLEWIQFCALNNVAFNRDGLISEHRHAAEIAGQLNREIPEHAPFAPCGVWVLK
jgi:hypothetical protein